MSEKTSVKFAKKNFKTLCKTLDQNKWKYEKDKKNFKINIDPDFNDVDFNVRISFNTGLEIISVYIPVSTAPRDRREIAAIAVSVANYDFIAGSFDYNCMSGNIIFRMTSTYADSLLSAKVFEYLLNQSCKIVKNYRSKIREACEKNLSEDGVIKLIGGVNV
ncbi:MAG: YbjN domain-containing protein [Roseburia sp.]|nr:YbjN domain-containing protein [Roseburia sp.]